MTGQEFLACEGPAATLPRPDCLECGNTRRIQAGQSDCPYCPCPWLTRDVLAVATEAYERRGRKCRACGGSGNCELRPIGNGAWSGACGPCGGTGMCEDGTLDPERLAVLSDALEESGCDSKELLAHLRSPGPHYRGCWAIDCLLGKS